MAIPAKTIDTNILIRAVFLNRINAARNIDKLEVKPNSKLLKIFMPRKTPSENKPYLLMRLENRICKERYTQIKGITILNGKIGKYELGLVPESPIAKIGRIRIRKDKGTSLLGAVALINKKDINKIIACKRIR